MNDITGSIIGISLGAIIIISIQAACYKFIAWENYHKAVVIALSSVVLAILATLLIVNLTK